MKSIILCILIKLIQYSEFIYFDVIKNFILK